MVSHTRHSLVKIGRTHPEHTLEHTEISHISVQTQRTIHNQATKVWIVSIWD
jgi:hypothetical protein